MVNSADFKEFMYTLFLIAGFCVAGLFVGIQIKEPEAVLVPMVSETPHAVRIIANPVVHIAVPEHNVFAK